MADLSTMLAAALGGSFTKPDFAAQDNYAPFANIANQLGQSAILAGDKFSTGEKVTAGLLSGLLGGAMTNLSDDYQARAKDAYQKAVLGNIFGQQYDKEATEDVLGSRLFQVAEDNSNLFKTMQGSQFADEARAAKAAESKAIFDAYLKDPRGTKRALEMLQPKNETEPVIATESDPDKKLFNPLSTGQQGTSEKIKAYFNDFIESGMPEVQAASAAKQQVEAEIKANAKGFDEAKAARENANLLLNLANTAEAGMSQAGQTGSKFASQYEKLISTIAPWSTPEADKQATGDALLASLAPDLLKAARPAGVGAMSDPEMRVYLSTAPSADKTPEQNAIIVERMKNVANLNSDYADFLDAYKEANAGSVVGASKKWSEYTRSFPIFKGGEIDSSRPGWQEYFSAIGSGQNPNAVQLQDKISELGGGAPTMPTPPAGYELTGKVDANGNYGVRKIK